MANRDGYETDERILDALEALTGGDFNNGSDHPEEDTDPAVVAWREGYDDESELRAWLDENRAGWRDEAPLCWGQGHLDVDVDARWLVDMYTNYRIREATADEAEASDEAANHDGGRGAIGVIIDGQDRTCYVEEE